MGELIWHHPCNELSHHLSLIIYSLDGEENLSKQKRLAHYRTQVNQLSQSQINNRLVNLHLSERTWCNHIVHPLHSKASAQLDCLHMTFSCSSKSREEEAHAEGIVDITEGINEGWIPAKQRSTSNIYEVLFWQKHLTFEIKIKNKDNLHVKSCKKKKILTDS